MIYRKKYFKYKKIIKERCSYLMCGKKTYLLDLSHLNSPLCVKCEVVWITKELKDNQLHRKHNLNLN